jgi:DNA mismatch repair protein MutL
MLSRIHQLDRTLVNQIAAGEVIERPGSVIKELLENSVDAGATQIDVEVEQGGIELIRVVDDGSGILAEDLPLAFSSHATSKLFNSTDLESILTLGFRGEALASIGSVAQVQLQSRPRESEQGAQLRCDGGKLATRELWNGRPGTRVEVRHLFYNLPARRKFLKTVPTEMSHITEAIIRLALGFPHLGVRLSHHERDVYAIASQSSTEERITRFFGEEVGSKLVAIQAQQGPLRLSGYVAEPSVNRGNARLQYFFVNGRCIRDRTLSHALQEALHGLLMVGRYAIGFLYLEVPPDQVDVNVHPTKAEVRFRDSQMLHHLVRSAIRAALQGRGLQSSFSLTRNGASPQNGSGSWTLTRPAAPASALFTEPARSAPGFPALTPTPNLPSRSILVETAGQTNPTNSASASAQAFPTPSPTPLHASPPNSSIQALEAQVQNANSDSFQSTANFSAKALQFHDAYLVVEEAAGMLVIDQHALHERVLYEQLKTRLRQGTLEIQRLLVPEPVDLPAEQHALALAHQKELAQIGLEVQNFGGTTILVNSYPAMMVRGRPAALVRSALEHLASAGEPPSVELLVDHLLRLMACHAAIKAGDKLTSQEMDALLAQRHLVADSHHCPHGRPTSLFFSKQELDKQFERI